MEVVGQAEHLYHRSAVKGRCVVVPVLLALSGLGWAAAHAVAHRAVMTEPAMPQSGMSQYLSYLTTSIALCLALALPLAAGAVLGKRWHATSVRSLWLFGLVPVLGFVGHTLATGSGTGSSFSAIAPIALVGLLVQIPFALVAVGLARRVLWLAAGLARALAAPAVALTPRPAPSAYPRPRASRARAFTLDLGHTQRGPPLLAA
jgi:uncharacterized membrane protein YhaH (DUF805 family)